jgi:hypothetical protein
VTLNMTPNLPICYQTNGGGAAFDNALNLDNAVSMFAHPSYCKNLCVCQFMTSVFYSLLANFSEMRISVLMILRTSYILQIMRSIIQFLSIFMIYFILCWPWSNKSFSNNSMYQEFFTDSLVKKNNSFIPATNLRIENFASQSKTSYAPKIAGFIKFFVTWHWLPFFHEFIIAPIKVRGQF